MYSSMGRRRSRQAAQRRARRHSIGTFLDRKPMVVEVAEPACDQDGEFTPTTYTYIHVILLSCSLWALKIQSLNLLKLDFAIVRDYLCRPRTSSTLYYFNASSYSFFFLFLRRFRLFLVGGEKVGLFFRFCASDFKSKRGSWIR